MYSPKTILVSTDRFKNTHHIIVLAIILVVWDLRIAHFTYSSEKLSHHLALVPQQPSLVDQTLRL